MIQATCSCGKSFQAKPELGGKRVKCPACDGSFVVPLAPESRAMSAATEDTINVGCSCGKHYRAKAALAGKAIKCRGCGSSITVPENSSLAETELGSSVNNPRSQFSSDPFNDPLPTSGIAEDPLGIDSIDPLSNSATDPTSIAFPQQSAAAQPAWNSTGQYPVQNQKQTQTTGLSKPAMIALGAGAIVFLTLIGLSFATFLGGDSETTAQKTASATTSQNKNDTTTSNGEKSEEPAAAAPQELMEQPSSRAASSSSKAETETELQQDKRAIAPENPAVAANVDTQYVQPQKSTADIAAQNRLLTQARQSLRQGNRRAAISTYKRLLAMDENHDAHLSLARVLYEQGYVYYNQQQLKQAYTTFIEVADHYRKWREKHEPDDDIILFAIDVFYNEACSLSQLGRPDEAISALRDSFEAGQLNFRQIDEYSDFNPIRNNQAFQDLVGEYRNKELADEQLLRRATQLLQEGQINDAIADLKTLIGRKPEHSARFLLASMVHEVGLQIATKGNNPKVGCPMMIDAAEHYREWAKANNQSAYALSIGSTILYNAACSLTFQGKTSAAMKTLREALDTGFDDFKQLETDDSLARLRGPKLNKLIAEYRPKFEQKQRAKAAAIERDVTTKMSKYQVRPASFELTNLSGKRIKLSSFRGKVVVINFWTTRDLSRTILPRFVELKKRLGNKGLEVTGVNYDGGSPARIKREVAKVMRQAKVNYPSLIGNASTRGEFKLRGFPTTIFVDRNGKARMMLEGPFNHNPQLIEAAIVRLLKEQ